MPLISSTKRSLWTHRAQGIEICTLEDLKPLHQVLPDRPHPRPLAVNIHWDSEQETRHLDAPDSKEDLPRPVGLEPVREEEREDEAVEDVCSDNQHIFVIQIYPSFPSNKGQ